MLASNRTTNTIAFFVGWVRDATLAVWLAVIMTNCDCVQINMLKAVYLDCQGHSVPFCDVDSRVKSSGLGVSEKGNVALGNPV